MPPVLLAGLARAPLEVARPVPQLHRPFRRHGLKIHVGGGAVAPDRGGGIGLHAARRAAEAGQGGMRLARGSINRERSDMGSPWRLQ